MKTIQTVVYEVTYSDGTTTVLNSPQGAKSAKAAIEDTNAKIRKITTIIEEEYDSKLNWLQLAKDRLMERLTTGFYWKFMDENTDLSEVTHLERELAMEARKKAQDIHDGNSLTNPGV